MFWTAMNDRWRSRWLVLNRLSDQRMYGSASLAEPLAAPLKAVDRPPWPTLPIAAIWAPVLVMVAEPLKLVVMPVALQVMKLFLPPAGMVADWVAPLL